MRPIAFFSARAATHRRPPPVVAAAVSLYGSRTHVPLQRQTWLPSPSSRSRLPTLPSTSRRPPPPSVAEYVVEQDRARL
jgi:hypothetical protein